MKASTAYEAASSSRRTLGWYAPTLGPNDSILGNLRLLRDRSRTAVRNDGFAGGIIGKLVSNIVGTGIKPMSLATDRAFRAQLQDLWTRWTDETDADGLLDLYGQQAQAVRCWLEGGEAFVRLRYRLPSDELTVPLQLQVLEPELCPHDYNIVAANGNKVRAGIEFDRIGRRVAYYFYATRPGELQDWSVGDLRRVPAESVLHIFKPLRAGQIRGLPHLTAALIRLRELDKFDDAVLIRQQLAAMFVAFLKPAANNEDGNLDVLTGAAPASTEGSSPKRPVLGLKPGLFQELAPGEEVQFSDPPTVDSGYADYMQTQLRAACSAANVPYEIVTGDMSGLNDRVMRVLLSEFRRAIQADQHQTVAFQFCRPVWAAFLDQVFLNGILPIPPAYLDDAKPYGKVQWQPQGWPYLHPVQDAEADVAAIRAGFTSRAAIVSENGDDTEVIDQQQAEDNARADKLGLKYDSDGRNQKASAAAAPPGAPKKNDNQQDQADQGGDGAPSAAPDGSAGGEA